MANGTNATMMIQTAGVRRTCNSVQVLPSCSMASAAVRGLSSSAATPAVSGEPCTMSRTIGAPMAAQISARYRSVVRQPLWANQPVISGGNRIAPIGLPDRTSPRAMPRRARNHRTAKVVPVRGPAKVIPSDKSTMWIATICQSVVAIESKNMPAANDSAANVTNNVVETRSTSRPASGESRPTSRTSRETAIIT